MTKAIVIQQKQGDVFLQDTVAESFWYPVNETDSIIIRPFEKTKTAVSFKFEAGAERQIAQYNQGRWFFKDYAQRQEFFMLFAKYRKEFYKALTLARRLERQKPKHYRWTCLKRNFKLQIVNLKRTIQGR